CWKEVLKFAPRSASVQPTKTPPRNPGSNARKLSCSAGGGKPNTNRLTRDAPPGPAPVRILFTPKMTDTEPTLMPPRKSASAASEVENRLSWLLKTRTSGEPPRPCDVMIQLLPNTPVGMDATLTPKRNAGSKAKKLAVTTPAFGSNKRTCGPPPTP